MSCIPLDYMTRVSLDSWRQETMKRMRLLLSLDVAIYVMLI